jgi:alpha-N-arabinofuranosidase
MTETGSYAIRIRMYATLRLLVVTMLLAACGARQPVGFQAGDSVIAVTVHDEVRNRIPMRLFGQFLERASFGEPGPEAIADRETGDLPAAVLDKLRAMSIPLIRFPGGTDVDFIDWTDMIDHVPGRAGGRPVTIGHSGEPIGNRFGYHEYFRVRDLLGNETILVVNLLDALAKRKPVREAALHAAGLLAYVNAPVSARLPEGMPDWPMVRAKNGHPEPFGIQFLQIGNEWFAGRFRDVVKAALATDDVEAHAAWYVTCLHAYLDAIRAVDPAIPLIVDAETGWPGEQLARRVLADPRVRKEVRYAALHSYAPGPSDHVGLAGGPTDAAKLTDEDWWRAWVAMPGRYDADGLAMAFPDEGKHALALGYRLASTEWNWNGWGLSRLPRPPGIGWGMAAGLGAAGFLHGLMRQGDAFDLATQSILIGQRWSLNSVRVDPTGELPPRIFPTGAVTAFYAKHHGDRRLRVETNGIPTYTQPFRIGWSWSHTTVAMLDVLATASDTRLFVHIINWARARSFDLALALRSVSGRGTVHVLAGDPMANPAASPAEVGRVSSRPVDLAAAGWRVSVPAASITIVEVER